LKILGFKALFCTAQWPTEMGLVEVELRLPICQTHLEFVGRIDLEIIGQKNHPSCQCF